MVWNDIIWLVIRVGVDFKINNTYRLYTSLDWVIIGLDDG